MDDIKEIVTKVLQETTGKDSIFPKSVDIDENNVVIEQDFVSVDGEITYVFTTIKKPSQTSENIENNLSTIQSDVKEAILKPAVKPIAEDHLIPTKTTVKTVINDNLSP